MRNDAKIAKEVRLSGHAAPREVTVLLAELVIHQTGAGT